MSQKRIMIVAGARPNFIKIAPLIHAFQAQGTYAIDLVHTGQHYDRNMSGAFFAQLDIPEPSFNLGIGSGTHAEQVGHTMIGLERVMRETGPDLAVVVGDVNATCAAAVTAAKEHIPLAHVEAGLRSGDWSMPEEINRIVTDRLSSILFTTDHLADENLLQEGCAPAKIKRVGNIMIDTLEKLRQQAAEISLSSMLGESFSGETPYSVLTLHRPSNVDHPEILSNITGAIIHDVASVAPLVWPIHPRTRQKLEQYGLMDDLHNCPNIVDVPPLSYLEMLRLNMSASVMLTDSGGLQEESCILGTPCLTLRDNTERPLTLIEHGGSCVLVGNDRDKITKAFRHAWGSARTPYRPEMWDGKTGCRIVDHIHQWLGN
jgi:UDP-N-acetylglucosamine 2-epimerase (non-hydrolysing)